MYKYTKTNAYYSYNSWSEQLPLTARHTRHIARRTSYIRTYTKYIYIFRGEFTINFLEKKKVSSVEKHLLNSSDGCNLCGSFDSRDYIQSFTTPHTPFDFFLCGSDRRIWKRNNIFKRRKKKLSKTTHCRGEAAKTVLFVWYYTNVMPPKHMSGERFLFK